MSKVQPEKGVPIPKRGNERYAFKSMEVGDSFLIPRPEHIDLRTHRARVAALGSGWKRALAGAYDFQTKIEGDAVRIWRIK